MAARPGKQFKCSWTGHRTKGKFFGKKTVNIQCGNPLPEFLFHVPEKLIYSSQQPYQENTRQENTRGGRKKLISSQISSPNIFKSWSLWETAYVKSQPIYGPLGPNPAGGTCLRIWAPFHGKVPIRKSYPRHVSTKTLRAQLIPFSLYRVVIRSPLPFCTWVCQLYPFSCIFCLFSFLCHY